MLTIAVVVGAVGLGWRWFAVTSTTATGSATSEAGLQVARSIASGRFAWFIDDGSGPSSGSIGALVLGAMIRLIGETAAVATASIGIGVIAATLLVVVVRRRLAGPWPHIGAAVWLCGSSAAIASGAHITDEVVVTMMLGLILLALVEPPDGPRWWAVGLVLGLGWWTSGLITSAVAPLLAVLAHRRIAPTVGGWLAFGAAFTVGASPRLVDEALNGLPMFRALWASPDDALDHVLVRSVDLIGAALGLTDRSGAWSAAGARWVALAVAVVLLTTVAVVLVRQPRSRSALLLTVPSVLAVDLVTAGWGRSAHDLAVMIGPAVAVMIVLALSALPAAARPSAAIVTMIVIALLGSGGMLAADRSGDQPPTAAVRTESSAAANRAEE
jgi:hypothetical protein